MSTAVHQPQKIPSWIRLGLLLSAPGLLCACQRYALDANLPGSALPETALVPQDAVAVVSMTSQLDQIAQQAPAHQSELQSKINLFKAGLQAAGIDYTQDVLPWVGKQLTLAVVDPSFNALNPHAGILFTATTRNAKASSEFLEKLRQQAHLLMGAEFSTQKKGNLTLSTQTASQSGVNLVTAEFGDRYIAIANSSSTMEKAIALHEHQTGSQSIAQQSSFSNVVKESFTPKTFLFAYINGTQLATDPQVLAALPPTANGKLLREQLQGIRSLTLSTQWTDSGFLLRSLVKVDPKNPWMTTSIPTASGQLVKRLPGDALAVITSDHPALTWKESFAKVSRDPQAKESLDQMRSLFQSTTGLSLEKDVLNWMNGESALALVPDPQALKRLSKKGANAVNASLQGINGLLVIESQQKPAAEITLRKLDKAVQAAGGKVITSKMA